MVIQKLYVEAYVQNGVQLQYEFDEQLHDDKRCSWRNVVMISEEETNDTFPEYKEERIREQVNRIEKMLDSNELCVTSEIGDELLKIADELKEMLS